MSLPNDIIGEWELTRVETYETKDGKTELISTLDISDPYKTTSGTWESLKIDANVIECINYSIDDNGNHDSSSEHFTYSISGNKLTLFGSTGLSRNNYTIEKISKKEAVFNMIVLPDYCHPDRLQIGKAYYRLIK